MILLDTDVILGCHCTQANGCALATRNVKDFTSTGLELVNPWQGET